MKYAIIFAAAAAASEAVYPTSVKDYDHHDCVVNKPDDKVLVYHTETTYTHEPTYPAGYAKPTGAYPTAAYPTSCWYEKYERKEWAKYSEMGPHAMRGGPVVDDCEDAKKYQHVYVEEVKGGKTSSYEYTHTYAAPTPYATKYPAAGKYTVPAQTCTVESTSYYAKETSKHYEAGEQCTYGGKYVEAEKTGYLTVPYGCYDKNGKPSMTSTTVYASSTGKVEVCKPTVTSYSKATDVKYATDAWYEPGVYRVQEHTVDAASAGHEYTCTYEQVKAYSTHYVYPTAKPMKPEEEHKYPVQPAKPSPAKPVKGDEECDEEGNPIKGGKYPVKPEDEKKYPVAYNGTYPAYPTGYPYAPSSDSKKPYPAKGPNGEDCDEEGKPIDSEHQPKPYAGKPMKPEESEHDKYPAGKPVDSDEHKPYPAGKGPNGEEEECDEEGKPIKGGKPYPGKGPSDDEHKYPAGKPVDSDEHNKYPAGKPTDSQTKGYPGKGPDSDEHKGYPGKKPVSDDEDCEDDKKPEDAKKGYKAHPRNFAL